MSGSRESRTPTDGARGREYRWRSWFLRIFGWDCGYVLTAPMLSHKVYVRWVFNPGAAAFGFLLGRDEDGEWGLDIAVGPLLRIESSLPEHLSDSGGDAL
jgi:hypothetical protein